MKLKWLWFDFWIGAFWDAKKRILYICLIPTIVFIIPFKQHSPGGE